MISMVPTCRIGGLRPELVLGLMILQDVCAEEQQPLVLTCGVDGVHATGSLHYAGSAVDIRSNTIPEPHKTHIVERMKAQMGPDFDFVLEDVGGANEHYHMEFQPKAAY